MPFSALPEADDDFDNDEVPSFVPFKPKRANAKRPPLIAPPDGVVLDNGLQNEAVFGTSLTF